MDRQYIHDHQVIERYLNGTLAADEEQAFEEAYLEDAELLDELKAAERLREGLKGLDAGGRLGPAGAPAAWRRTFTSPQYAAAASVLLAVTVVLSGTLYRENRALREETFAVGSAVTRLVPLVALRGANEIEVSAPAAAEWTVLLVDAGPTPYDSYRATLVRREGAPAQTIWSAGGLEPTPDGAIGIGVPGRMLTPGSYDAMVEARLNDWSAERFEEVVRVSLRVVARE
jgi:hypothetical protein